MNSRVAFTCVLLSIFFSTQGQTQEDIDSTLVENTVDEIKKRIPIGIYADFAYKLMPNPSAYNLSSEITFGLSYQRLFIGFFINQYRGNHNETLIFPNNFELNYRYGGIQTGVNVYGNKNLETRLVMNVGHGDMIWTQENNSVAFSRDEFLVVEPSLRIDFVPIRYLTLYGQGGFRTMRDLDLSGLTNKDFNGFTFGMGLRFRLINE